MISTITVGGGQRGLRVVQTQTREAQKMSDSSQLQELACEVRGDTVRILAAAKESWLTWSPPRTSNHMLWHAGMPFGSRASCGSSAI